MTAFKLGDTVVLKSGGPDMNVHRHTPKSQYSEETYHCQWFAGKKLETGSFAPEQLDLAVKVAPAAPATPKP